MCEQGLKVDMNFFVFDVKYPHCVKRQICIVLFLGIAQK